MNAHQTVIHGRPPNYEAILKVLPHAAGPGVIFAYRPHVYVPGGGELPPQIVAHEEVHMGQQAGGVEAWWANYLSDPQFRLDQEVPAHQAEWRAYKAVVKDRNRRAGMLDQIARKLASPLYGGLLPFWVAKNAVQA